MRILRKNNPENGVIHNLTRANSNNIPQIRNYF